jgi:hypothetical protein
MFDLLIVLAFVVLIVGPQVLAAYQSSKSKDMDA